jgi:hypothetical protein
MPSGDWSQCGDGVAALAVLAEAADVGAEYEVPRAIGPRVLRHLWPDANRWCDG